MTQLTIIDVFSYDTMNFYIVKRKIRRLRPPYSLFLLLAEGLAVGTLIHSGVSLVGAHQNPLQRTVVSILAVMLALLDSALNALVCMAIHRLYPPFYRDGIRFSQNSKNIHFISAYD